ncbi:13042_t:CDS:10 [Entrophospora sp. SA101]|nr:6884_t:CDS:10 [Entrophospora sp. SA101]CAJ0849375.1 13042_t:CDS:10 [Entrophospora sp. SA101]
MQLAAISKNILKLNTARSLLYSFKFTPRTFLYAQTYALKIQIRDYGNKVVKVPPLAESITEGTLAKWSKNEEVATIETDKIDAPINSPHSGKITKLFVDEQDNVTVQQDLFEIELGDAPAEASKDEAPKEESPKEEAPKQESKAESKVESPKEESKKETAPPSPQPKTEQKPSSAKSSSSAKPPPSTPLTISTSKVTKPEDHYKDRTESHVKMNRMRLRIAERLKEAQNTAASLTTFNEIDMSNIIDMRNTYKDAVMKKHNIKLGFLPPFVKASVVALQEIPSVNASIDGDSIIYRDYVDVSVAVATPKGLVTPVVRNAHLLSFIEIEKAIAELGVKAREGKITIEDMTGGTFTISNGGVYGSLFGTPIINLPQSAILGMHVTKERPVAINGKIEIRPMMYVALTYDHRLIDGREAVTFLKTIKEQVEDPRRLLLDV